MWSLGYTGSFVVSSTGLSGGLALFWLQPYSVSLKGYNARCIDVLVSKDQSMPWRATFVYGEPRRENRHEFWTLLRRIHNDWKGPWICCGDFNEVLCSDEHLGSSERSDAQMSLFRDCMEECGLVDLGYTGPKYTWNNRQEGDDLVRVRLDRAVANGDFLELFNDCKVENVITTTSDHFSLTIMVASMNDVTRPTPVHQQFHFEAAWLRAPTTKRCWRKPGKKEEMAPCLCSPHVII